jgi:hypothetical protein
VVRSPEGIREIAWCPFRSWGGFGLRDGRTPLSLFPLVFLVVELFPLTVQLPSFLHKRPFLRKEGIAATGSFGVAPSLVAPLPPGNLDYEYCLRTFGRRSRIFFEFPVELVFEIFCPFLRSPFSAIFIGFAL